MFAGEDAVFALWMYRLDKEQDEYLESLDQQLQLPPSHPP